MVPIVVLTALIFTVMAVVYIYKTKDTLKDVDTFVTSRGSLGPWMAMATIFASTMGSWIMFSPPEAATWGGIVAYGGYTVVQGVAIMAFALIGPRMRKIAPHGSSLTEFVYYRYGTAMYILVLVISIFYMSAFLCAELTGIALAVNVVTGLPLWLVASIVGIGTLIYTTYGGIRGTIFTDAIQAAIIVPTLLLAFIATTICMGGPGEIIERINNVNPALLSFNAPGAWSFTAGMVIAIVTAGMFNQGYWTRVWAAKDDSSVRKSFFTAGLLIIPVMLMTGTFGLMAISLNRPIVASSALFEVALVTPKWVLAVIMVAAMALVMSSVDTLINAIASVFIIDLARFKKDLSSDKLMVYSRVITAVICILVIIVASQGYSVLYLFLLADLVCAAAVVPTLFGLFGNRYPGWAAALSTIAGIAAGAPIFPDPASTRGNLLLSITIAIIVPTVLTLILSRAGKPIDFKELGEQIHDVKY